jgi:hypothetical protein
VHQKIFNFISFVKNHLSAANTLLQMICSVIANVTSARSWLLRLISGTLVPALRYLLPLSFVIYIHCVSIAAMTQLRFHGRGS